jgi:perosamine synthetase
MTPVARIPDTRRLALARPNIGDRELELVSKVLRSDVLAMGPFVKQFEERLASMVGRRHAVAVSSGTAGLHLAVRALDLGPGDEVITTPFSFVASSNALLFEDVRPVFVDIEERSLGMDPNLVEAAATARTRGILAVDVFGNPCQLDHLEELAGSHDWSLIEDSCEALGSRYAGRWLGSFGILSVFAFYPNKQITTGEGGMVLTDDSSIAERIRSMANQGRDQDGTWLRHVQLGFNYRLDELSGALGVAQLERYEELRAGRAQAAAAYGRRLAGREWITLPQALEGADVDWFVYVARLAPWVDRDRLIGQLDARGVPTRPYFAPIHLQPYYRERFGFQPGDFPVTERVAASTLALPFSSRLTLDEVDQVAASLEAGVEEQRAG